MGKNSSSKKDRKKEQEDEVVKQINEQKLKAFSIGTMGKRHVSKKEQEDQRKKEQEQAAAQAFEEYVATFQETPSKASKVWVKAGTYDAGRGQEDTREKGKLYKPQSRLYDFAEKSSVEKAQECARILSQSDRKIDRKKDMEKKKSNLELFKDELKRIQEEREERHKYKGVVKTIVDDGMPTKTSALAEEMKFGSFDDGDPTTTNLYLGNLNPKITEQQLMDVFGRYGPLASIKIMWPRSDEEKARGRNCGFVAFMNRKDGERALKFLNGKDVMSYEMKLGWGKAVPIPPHPIYVPPAMLKLLLPPPPSGLPFNAQPEERDKFRLPHLRPNEPFPRDERLIEELDKVLPHAMVKVVIPTDRNLLMLIHRMIEFVIREGPMFEAIIMNREINNPMFRFLFENQSPAHVYYRWKLFSLLQGDLPSRWRTHEFRMYKGGSIWKPPPMNPYTQGMPDELVEVDEKEYRKGSLSNSQRDRLEDMLRNLSPERSRITEAMMFCIEHGDAAEEICDCLAESLSILQTPIPKKIARLYLISDILHNCGVKVTNASNYRKGLEVRLQVVFQDVHAAYMTLESRLKAEWFKMRVMRMFFAWEEWAVYPKEFLIRLQNAFLGISSARPEGGGPGREGPGSGGEQEAEDLYEEPLDGAALLKGALKHAPDDDDIDGVPMEDLEEDPEGPRESRRQDRQEGLPAGFVPSRWETVDPRQAEAQAMTTSKWDLLEPQDDADGDDKAVARSDYKSRDGNEERRARLREIEVKAVEYQDELECGQRSLKAGWTIQQQVEHYRRKLLRKAEKEGQKEKEREERDNVSQESDGREKERASSRKKKERSKRSDSSEEEYYHKEIPSQKSKSKRSCSPVSPESSQKFRSPSTSPARGKARHSHSPRRKSRSSPASPPPRAKHRGSGSPASPRAKHAGSARKRKHKHKY
ncbi:U2 snRNP-associated SURP motif-containing protein [Bacillus rossius redtenbacheri]|uniref:U2 snRNP-associated SURP motif-containing protein n=1 Tax=Bacillus rossius redtenbacheri TaxID=93214 RepID=UPI002FDD463E